MCSTAALPDVKLRTTHRIGAETLATIIKLGAGLQKKKKKGKKVKNVENNAFILSYNGRKNIMVIS